MLKKKIKLLKFLPLRTHPNILGMRILYMEPIPQNDSNHNLTVNAVYRFGVG
jgi:hypothetical protein